MEEVKRLHGENGIQEHCWNHRNCRSKRSQYRKRFELPKPVGSYSPKPIGSCSNSLQELPFLSVGVPGNSTAVSYLQRMLELATSLEVAGYIEMEIKSFTVLTIKVNPLLQVEFQNLKCMERNNRIYFYKLIWSSIRILGCFNVQQIQSSYEEDLINEDLIVFYILKLLATGYVKLLEKWNDKLIGPESVLQLIRDSGPIAPIICEEGVIYDVNLQTVYEPFNEGLFYDKYAFDRHSDLTL